MPSAMMAKRMLQCVAWAWRTMLVTASRTARQRTVSSAALKLAADGGASQARVTPADVEGVAGAFDFGGEALGAVAADGFADFGEGGAGGGFYVGDLLGGALRVAVDEAAGELGFEDDDGESVAEDVV